MHYYSIENSGKFPNTSTQYMISCVGKEALLWVFNVDDRFVCPLKIEILSMAFHGYGIQKYGLSHDCTDFFLVGVWCSVALLYWHHISYG